MLRQKWGTGRVSKSGEMVPGHPQPTKAANPNSSLQLGLQQQLADAAALQQQYSSPSCRLQMHKHTKSPYLDEGSHLGAALVLAPVQARLGHSFLNLLPGHKRE